MSAIDLKGMRVLILEDEPMIAMLLCDIVSDLGCTAIGPAFTIEAALAEIESQTLDMALLDVTIGKEKSWSAAEKLAERGVPFAFLTGYGEHEYPKDRFPAAPVQMKPASVEMIETLLRSLAKKGRRSDT